MSKSYKELMNNQEELRILVINKMQKNEIGLVKTAKQIGIAEGTLTRFLHKGKNIGFFSTLCKVVNYIGEEKDQLKVE